MGRASCRSLYSFKYHVELHNMLLYWSVKSKQYTGMCVCIDEDIKCLSFKVDKATLGEGDY